MRPFFAVLGTVVQTTAEAIVWADRLACRALPYRLPRDRVLDKVLGPVEEIEYARTTAPRS